MAIIKCKMCGGDMVLNEEKTFGTCEYCGSIMTLPKVSDDQRAARFNRGNHFRRQGEFDKALAVYESIVREDDNDAEAHWCCALCRFGIEYVEDPNTLEYLPTCHRASFDSFLEDVDYLAALEHSDGITRRQYQKDAAKIAEVQKGILATSQNEEPFDVFICYKETDDDTKERTRDSLDAQEIYYQLTQEGYRVFFSRITLEDKVGTEYEPYIFAALNSAKVMVALGSKPEYFNAVWVKNEWSRFLAMMRKDRSKLLLPCYKGMDPYDLPEQLGVLQSYDMAKIGFMQDLIRGIKKVLRKNESSQKDQAINVNSAGVNIEPLLRRAFMFIDDGNWNEADAYFEKVLDQDPENPQAYLGKLMAEVRVRRQEDLAQCSQQFDISNNYQKAIRFGGEKLRSELKKAVATVKDRNELYRKTNIYSNALTEMKAAKTQEGYLSAAKAFSSIPGFKDSDSLSKQCFQKARECRSAELQNIYDSANTTMKAAKAWKDFDAAAEIFERIPGYQNADYLAKQCRSISNRIRADESRAIVSGKLQEVQKRELEVRTRLQQLRSQEIQISQKEQAVNQTLAKNTSRQSKHTPKWTVILCIIGVVIGLVIAFLIEKSRPQDHTLSNIFVGAISAALFGGIGFGIGWIIDKIKKISDGDREKRTRALKNEYYQISMSHQKYMQEITDAEKEHEDLLKEINELNNRLINI